MAKTYFPDVFIQPDALTASRIILMEEAGLSTAERWEVETAFLTKEIAALPGGLMIDYGCGIGRLSRVYLETHKDALAIGVDISVTMRVQSETYVEHYDRFGAVSPPVLATLADCGLRAQCAIAIWALQHMPSLPQEIDRLADVLDSHAPLLVVNRPQRLVPMMDAETRMVHWLDDGNDLDALLRELFFLDYEEPMPEALCVAGAYLRIYRRRPRADD